MSTVSSQQEFSEQLAEFQSSNEKNVMLIVSACYASVLHLHASVIVVLFSLCVSLYDQLLLNV